MDYGNSLFKLERYKLSHFERVFLYALEVSPRAAIMGLVGIVLEREFFFYQPLFIETK